MRRLVVFLVFAVGVCFNAASARAGIITVLLNSSNFSADPVTAVDFAGDGLSALIREDQAISPVFLSNDPGLGNPEVILAGNGVVLSFDYNFLMGTSASENDEFGVFVLNAAGVSAGPMFEFFTTSSGSGSVSFNLSSLVGEPFLGLQFQLSSLPGDGGLDSIVTISNLQLDVPGTDVIPEPSSLAIFLGLGVLSQIGMLVRRRRLQRQSS
jgi:hypothetical protein